MCLAVPRPSLLSCADLPRRLSGRRAVPRRAACCPFSAETGWRRAGPKGFAAAVKAAVSLGLGSCQNCSSLGRPCLCPAPLRSQSTQGAGCWPVPHCSQGHALLFVEGTLLGAKGQNGGKVTWGVLALLRNQSWKRLWKT